MNDYFDDMNFSKEEAEEAYKAEHANLLRHYDDHGELISSSDEEKDKALLHRMSILKSRFDYDD